MIILKNLWNRRGKCAWLFIELIVVTCIAWYILDPALVNMADASLPLGYDADRLVIIEVASLPEADARYDSIANHDDTRADNMNRMLAKIRNYGGVEQLSAQSSGNILNSQGIAIEDMHADVPNDSLAKGVNTISFISGQHYFETYGIKSVQGSPTVEELSARSYTPFTEVVVT